MSSPRELREQLVRDLLQDEWNSSNTYGQTPNITFGNYDSKTQGTPLVAIDTAREGSSGGGLTGYDSIDGSGGGPRQTRTGTVDCHGWCHRDDLDSANTDHQRQYLGAVTEEIRRIAEANATRPTNPQTSNQPVRYIAPGEAEPVPEPNEQALYHRVIPVTYAYHTND